MLKFERLTLEIEVEGKKFTSDMPLSEMIAEIDKVAKYKDENPTEKDQENFAEYMEIEREKVETLIKGFVDTIFGKGSFDSMMDGIPKEFDQLLQLQTFVMGEIMARADVRSNANEYLDRTQRRMNARKRK